MIVLSVLISAIALVTLASSQRDAEAINIAGSLRMQSYRLGYEMQRAGPSLAEHRAVWQKTLSAPALQKLNHWYVPEDVKQRYQQLHLGWQEMDTRIASGDTGWYQNHIEDFVGRIDAFVLALQHYTEHKIQLVIFMSLTGGLGILLLAAATDCESLDYATVAAAAPGGSALYLKTAFLLILCGYSCKAELFPLYTVGVDANFAAPAPASALISTGLVNAGFLALLRVYKLLAATEVFPWVKSVLLLVGVLSLVVGALFLRRTNNYKRFLSYSTVENMGIAAIGLGIGGIGVWAAVFHVVCHTLIKSSLFLQIAVVRQVYGNYRINRIGDYIHINRVGAVGLLTGMVVLVAFPPSPLFLSELMILKQTIADGRWWLVTGIMLLLCLVIYFFCSRLLRLCYQPRQDELHPSATDRALSWSALSLLAAAIGLGLWQPAFFRELIDRIASL